jgi:cellulose synthase/poly-beta-1,6-N-acetylglucosamine synthase-like glycosyltransferase
MTVFERSLLILSASWLFYTYAGYPICLRVLATIRRRPFQRAAYEPMVSVIIAVHNEEDKIAAKIENLLTIDYPRERLEIIVVSDRSTDRTDDTVRSYETQGVRLVRSTTREGKHHAQHMGLAASRGDIIVFTDSAPLLQRQALTNLMSCFADDAIGAAGGEDRVLHGNSLAPSESMYVRYDMMLRRAESLVNSSVGLSGAFFAVRRELCAPWRSDQSSDFSLALEAVRRGMRAVNDETALHYYTATASHGGEFQRKVRTVLNGLVVFFRSLDLLNPFRHGLFSWQLFSHKLCRWLAPFALAVFFVVCLLTSGQSLPFLVTSGAQIVFYALAVVGLSVPSTQKYSGVRLPAFFCLSNAAIVYAWYRWMSGRNEQIWSPTRR